MVCRVVRRDSENGGLAQGVACDCDSHSRDATDCRVFRQATTRQRGRIASLTPLIVRVRESLNLLDKPERLAGKLTLGGIEEE